MRPRGRPVSVAALLVATIAIGCRGSNDATPQVDASTGDVVSLAKEAAEAAPFDAWDESVTRALTDAPAATESENEASAPGESAGRREHLDDGGAETRSRRRCPREMVDVEGRLCVDRYEASLVDELTGRKLSPHYPPEPEVARHIFEKWQEARLTMGPLRARAIPLPLLPEVERTTPFRPKAVSHKDVLPQGYISGKVAGEACARAGKRLCTHEEWMFACRGEGRTKFPYGPEYRPGSCNVFRSSHPAAKLHDDASAGHSDPRLGLVSGDDGPLLRKTGATKTCASRWGDDAIYDMVGNEDEWIDDPNGTFVGGFFSRSTREGCESMVTVHPLLHWDYSIGLRCCAAPH